MNEPLMHATIALAAAIADARIRRATTIDIDAIVRLLVADLKLSERDAADLREAARRFAEPIPDEEPGP